MCPFLGFAASVYAHALFQAHLCSRLMLVPAAARLALQDVSGSACCARRWRPSSRPRRSPTCRCRGQRARSLCPRPRPRPRPSSPWQTTWLRPPAARRLSLCLHHIRKLCCLPKARPSRQRQTGPRQAAPGSPVVPDAPAAAVATERSWAAPAAGSAVAAVAGAVPDPPEGPGHRVSGFAGPATAGASPGASPLPSPGRRLSAPVQAVEHYPRGFVQPPPPPLFREGPRATHPLAAQLADGPAAAQVRAQALPSPAVVQRWVNIALGPDTAAKHVAVGVFRPVRRASARWQHGRQGRTQGRAGAPRQPRRPPRAAPRSALRRPCSPASPPWRSCSQARPCLLR